MHRIDGEGATSENKFTVGNPATGAVATKVTADILNAFQEEVAGVVEFAGLPLVKADNTQLRQAIVSMITGGGVGVSAVGVSIADAAEYFAGGEVEAALQQLGAKVYAGTFSANQIRRSVVAFNGSALNLNAGHAEAIIEISWPSATVARLRPDIEVDLPIGTAFEVAQAGAGKVEFEAGVGVTLLKGASFNARTLEQHAIIVAVKTAANTWRIGGMLEAA